MVESFLPYTYRTRFSVYLPWCASIFLFWCKYKHTNRLICWRTGIGGWWTHHWLPLFVLVYSVWQMNSTNQAQPEFNKSWLFHCPPREPTKNAHNPAQTYPSCWHNSRHPPGDCWQRLILPLHWGTQAGTTQTTRFLLETFYHAYQRFDWKDGRGVVPTSQWSKNTKGEHVEFF